MVGSAAINRVGRQTINTYFFGVIERLNSSCVYTTLIKGGSCHG